MKNKDVLAMEKAKIVEKMNQAIKDDDTKAFSEAFTELCQKIEDNVLEQAKEMLVEQDATILAQRGVRPADPLRKNSIMRKSLRL